MVDAAGLKRLVELKLDAVRKGEQLQPVVVHRGRVQTIEGLLIT